jgi:hypothetical protein
MNKSTSEILGECIADIDSGHWVCGQLITDENGTIKEKESPNFKPMGCAIGLVGINSGAANLVKRHGSPYWEMGYPSDDPEGEDYTPEAKKAVELLAATSHMEEREKESIRGRDGGDLAVSESIVIDTNDNLCHTPAQARKWFKKAYDLAVSQEADSDEK